MQDILTQLHALHRPRLLMRAARAGAEDYRRTAHLGRLLGPHAPEQHSAALVQLMEIEASLNDQRLNEEACYNLLRHVEVLIAIVAEARTLRALRDAAA